jgi:hypothetical protein
MLMLGSHVLTALGPPSAGFVLEAEERGGKAVGAPASLKGEEEEEEEPPRPAVELSGGLVAEDENSPPPKPPPEAPEEEPSPPGGLREKEGGAVVVVVVPAFGPSGAVPDACGILNVKPACEVDVEEELPEAPVPKAALPNPPNLGAGAGAGAPPGAAPSAFPDSRPPPPDAPSAPEPNMDCVVELGPEEAPPAAPVRLNPANTLSFGAVSPVAPGVKLGLQVAWTWLRDEAGEPSMCKE